MPPGRIANFEQAFQSTINKDTPDIAHECSKSEFSSFLTQDKASVDTPTFNGSMFQMSITNSCNAITN